MTFNASGVTATDHAGTSHDRDASRRPATVPVTGLCVPGAESYGGQTISYVALGAGQSVTLSLTGCNPDFGTGGAAGTGGTTGTARRARHRRHRRDAGDDAAWGRPGVGGAAGMGGIGGADGAAGTRRDRRARRGPPDRDRRRSRAGAGGRGDRRSRQPAPAARARPQAQARASRRGRLYSATAGRRGGAVGGRSDRPRRRSGRAPPAPGAGCDCSITAAPASAERSVLLRGCSPGSCCAAARRAGRPSPGGPSTLAAVVVLGRAPGSGSSSASGRNAPLCRRAGIEQPRAARPAPARADRLDAARAASSASSSSTSPAPRPLPSQFRSTARLSRVSSIAQLGGEVDVGVDPQRPCTAAPVGAAAHAPRAAGGIGDADGAGVARPPCGPASGSPPRATGRRAAGTARPCRAACSAPPDRTRAPRSPSRRRPAPPRRRRAAPRTGTSRRPAAASGWPGRRPPRVTLAANFSMNVSNAAYRSRTRTGAAGGVGTIRGGRLIRAHERISVSAVRSRSRQSAGGVASIRCARQTEQPAGVLGRRGVELGRRRSPAARPAPAASRR